MRTAVAAAEPPGRLSEIAARVKADLLAGATTPEYLKDPSYSAAIDAYAFASAKVRLLREYVDGHDVRSALAQSVQETPRRSLEVSAFSRVLDALQSAEKLLAYYVRRLGLDPLSRAELGRSFAAAVKADLAEIWKDKPEGGKPE